MLGLSFPSALDADAPVTPKLLWLRLNPVWPQNSRTWTTLTAGEAPRVWLESGMPGLLASLLAGLHQRKPHTQGRQGLYFTMWAQQGQRPAEDPGWTLNTLEDSEQILEAERLLSCKPWFQGSQCKRAPLCLSPRKKFLHLTFLSPFNTLF